MVICGYEGRSRGSSDTRNKDGRMANRFSYLVKWKQYVYTVRLVKEGNWDDPNNGVPVTGSAYIDNVSFKKVTLYEDLIDDEGFEKDPETGTTTTWTMVNNTDANIQYGSGSTPGGGGPGYHEGDETHMYGETTYTFTGTGIRWLSAKNVDCGVADVYIDGVLDKTVDLYNDSLVNATVYEKTGLENKEHTIKIVNKDEADRPYVPMGWRLHMKRLQFQRAAAVGSSMKVLLSRADRTISMAPRA